MICTIALNSSIIACSCVCTQKGTTLRMITSDSFNYVNKKRYTISLVIFVCAFVWFHKWICHDSAVLYAEYVSAVWCFEERYSDTNLFYVVVAWIRMSLWNLLLFFQIIAGLTWFFVAFMVNDVALEQVSLLVSPVFLCWSLFHYWCILFSTVHIDVLVEITRWHIIMLSVLTLGAPSLHWHFVQAWLRSYI